MPTNKIGFVLYHSYGDGSGFHIERIYCEETRAKEDFSFLTEGEGKAPRGEWFLTKVPVV